jgi:hypothetical protein
VGDHDVALGKVIGEVRRGAIGEPRRLAEPKGERQSVHPEREGRNRDEREEELGEDQIEAERAGRHVDAEGVRDGRGPESQGGPEESSA